jgi:hypothetical protein
MDERINIIESGMKSKTGYSGKKAIRNGNIFLFNRKWKTLIEGEKWKWLCAQAGCRAGLITKSPVNGRCLVLKSTEDHLHTKAGNVVIQVEKVKATIKNEAKVSFILCAYKSGFCQSNASKMGFAVI